MQTALGEAKEEAGNGFPSGFLAGHLRQDQILSRGRRVRRG